MRRFQKRVTAIVLLVWAIGVWGANSAQAESSRSVRKFGFYFDLLGDPMPNIWGINIAYNLFSFLRINAGYGQVGSLPVGTGTMTISSYGGGIKFFMPNWNFSPAVGINYNIMNVSATGSVGSGAYGLTGAGSYPALSWNVGLDWQTGGAFYLGAGYSMVASTGVGLPYFNLGFFF